MQSKRQKDYKNDTVQDLALSTSGESLNPMSDSGKPTVQAKSFLPLEGHEMARRDASRIPAFIPVIHKDGTPLMPCKPAKAYKLIRGGVAEKRWDKLGIFYLQMLVETAHSVQPIVLGLDPGSKYDGVAVLSETKVQTTAMLELPAGIADKLENRRHLRRARRYRNCRRRPQRFDNRKRPDGWIAPSQKAKVEFRLKIISEFRKLYPITDFVVEDVRFNHFKKRWGKHFSTVEIGKKLLHDTLQQWGTLKLYEGWQTAEIRTRLGLSKTKKKSERSVASHAIDAIAIVADWLGTLNLDAPEFWVFKRPNLRRRSLHLQNPAKGGIRRVHGGTIAMGIKKNTLCLWRDGLYRTGGSTKGRLSLHDLSLEAKRVTQDARLEEATLLWHQPIFRQGGGAFSPA